MAHAEHDAAVYNTHLDPDTTRAAVSLLDGNGHENGHQQADEPTEERSEALATA